MKLDAVIVGVGGQGTLLASRVLGALAGMLGESVRLSEVHGMSQRGGSVVTYARIGEGASSSVVEEGCADVVLSFELLEALRALPYLKRQGIMLVNTQKIAPMPVVSGAAEYPADALESLEGACDTVSLDALALAEQAGDKRAVNLVLLGVLCRLIGGDADAWRAAVRLSVPERLLDVNLVAFDLGYNAQVRRSECP